MFRKLGLLSFLCSVVVLSFGLSASAQESVGQKQAEVAAAQERLAQIRLQAGSSYEAYNNAVFQLEALETHVDTATKRLSTAEEELEVAQAGFEKRTAQVYRSGNVGFMDVLMGAESFTDFASRVELWLRLLGEEHEQVERLNAARDEFAAARDELAAVRDEKAGTAEDAKAQRSAAEQAEGEVASYLASLDGELRQMLEAQERRRIEEALLAARAAQSREDSVPEAQADSAAGAGTPETTIETQPVAETREVPERQPAAEQAPADQYQAEPSEETAEVEAEAAADIAEPAAEEQYTNDAQEQQYGDEQYAAEGQYEDTQYASDAQYEEPAASGGAEVSGGSGSAVVSEAQSWLGVPYVYGGTSRSGVDCSGLTMQVFAQFGISLPHSAAGQYGYGSPVSSPGPGDLVFGDFSGSGSITHVGIATGDGQMINAPYPGTVVRYDPIYPEYTIGYRSLI